MSRQAGAADRVGLTDRGRALLAAGATLCAAGILLGFVDLTRVGLFAAALPLVALAALHSPPPRLDVEIRPGVEGMSPGEPGAVRIRLLSAGARGCRPGAVEVRFPADAAATGPARAHVGYLTPGAAAVLDVPLVPRRRGRYRIGPVTARRVDLFGLAAAVRTLDEGRDLVVLPRITPVSAVARRAGGDTGDGVPTLVASLLAEEDVAIRAYAVGDDLRRIHWPVTAHRGELMVRHEGRPTQRRALLVLDPAMPVTPGSTISPALDQAVDLLASLASALSRTAHDVELVVLGPVGDDDAAPGEGDVVPGGPGGAAELGRLLERLAVVEPAPAYPDPAHEADRARRLDRIRETAARGALVLAAAAAAPGGHTPELAHAAPLPPGARGTIFLFPPVAPGGHEHGGPGPGSPAPAAPGPGWRTVDLAPGTGPAQAWAWAGGERSAS